MWYCLWEIPRSLGVGRFGPQLIPFKERVVSAKILIQSLKNLLLVIGSMKDYFAQLFEKGQPESEWNLGTIVKKCSHGYIWVFIVLDLDFVPICINLYVFISSELLR